MSVLEYYRHGVVMRLPPPQPSEGEACRCAWCNHLHAVASNKTPVPPAGYGPLVDVNKWRRRSLVHCFNAAFAPPSEESLTSLVWLLRDPQVVATMNMSFVCKALRGHVYSSERCRQRAALQCLVRLRAVHADTGRVLRAIFGDTGSIVLAYVSHIWDLTRRCEHALVALNGHDFSVSAFS
jgi:hypothetical protein